MKNLVKRKLKAGKPSVGTWIGIGHPDITMHLANLGFDWLVCDMEHGPFGVETYHFMTQSMLYARSWCSPMARVPWNDLVWIKKALDAGAYGVVVPRIETKEEAEKAVGYCRYPPMGERGAGPRLAAFRDAEYFETANEEILVVLMVESKKGVENVDEIFSVEGVDACFIGPSDLSRSLGIHKQYNDHRFVDAVEKIFQSAKDHGVAPGMHCSNRKGNITCINDAIKKGFQFVALNSATSFLTTGAEILMKEVESWKPSMSGLELEMV